MAQLATLDKPTKPRTATEDRSAKIFLTAAEIIYKKGFDATSMNDIAKKVNLTKAGLYYYTKGKVDLLYKIMDFAMECVERDIMEPCQDIADPEHRLQQIIRNHLMVIAETGGAITILIEEVEKLSSTQKRKIIDRNRRYLELVRTALRELKQQGRLRDLDVTVAALNMFATILGVARWWDPKGRLSNRRIADEVTNFVLAGLLWYE